MEEFKEENEELEASTSICIRTGLFCPVWPMIVYFEARDQYLYVVCYCELKVIIIGSKVHIQEDV